ncbi:MAG: 50S ribosomal protein L37ae [Candidatus Marsarchaeota archaeon]|jgi:large subunit ribosomal protein L37Ae|nr:50S ribosomal protein L37ae [Candidatus Marsarchaeota archaeon]
MANQSIRYGASIRKRVIAIGEQKRARYKCETCGRVTVRRVSTSIWKCSHCGVTYAGGAYTLTTTAGEAAKRIIGGMSSG